MKEKKIIIAVALTEETQKPFLYLKEIPIPLNAEIQLIHMVTENVHGQDQINLKLEILKNEIFPLHTKIFTKILVDTNIRAAFTDYVAKEKADLVVVATRGRHGIKDFFDSSFAQHQVKYSPANVLVLR